MGSLEDGTYVEGSKATVSEYLSEWLEGLAVQGLRNSTWLSYDINMRTLVIPRIGAVPLQKLSPATLNALYSELLERGRRNGGPLSLRTVRYCHTILKKALGDAVDAGLLVRNPADRAKPPSAKATRANVMRTWTPEQLARFLRHVRDDRLYAAFLLGASTGLRRGELLGLRWRDLDLEAGQLCVVQTLIAPGTTRSSSASRRPSAGAGRWSWTPRPWTPCGSTRSGSSRSGWPSAPATRTSTTSSSGRRTGGSSTRATSPGHSRRRLAAPDSP